MAAIGYGYHYNIGKTIKYQESFCFLEKSPKFAAFQCLAPTMRKDKTN